MISLFELFEKPTVHLLGIKDLALYDLYLTKFINLDLQFLEEPL